MKPLHISQSMGLVDPVEPGKATSHVCASTSAATSDLDPAVIDGDLTDFRQSLTDAQCDGDALFTCTHAAQKRTQPADQPCSNVHLCPEDPSPYAGKPYPLCGAHRRNWAAYGHYAHLPATRWVHNLEHGAVVFLRHHCSGTQFNEELESWIRSLPRRIQDRAIVTAYAPLDSLFAVVTYKHSFEACHLDAAVKSDLDNWINAHFDQGTEHVAQSGAYMHGLIPDTLDGESLQAGSQHPDTAVGQALDSAAAAAAMDEQQQLDSRVEDN